MGSKFYRGRTATWDDNAGQKWADSVNGATGATPPGPGDDVLLDGQSGTAADRLTLGKNVAVKSLTTIGVANGFTLDMGDKTVTLGDGQLALTTQLALAFVLGAAFLFTATTDNGGAGWNVNTGTHGMPTLVFNGAGGRWKILDGLVGFSTATPFQLLAGTLDLNGKTFNPGLFSAPAGPSARTLILTGAAITVKGGGGTVWTVDPSTTLVGAPMPTIVLSGDAADFAGGGHAYGVVRFTGGDVCNLLNADSFVDLERLPPLGPFNPELVHSFDIVCTGTFRAKGADKNHRFIVHSHDLGTSKKITAAVTDLADVDFQDIQAAGAAAWTGTRLGDCGGTSGFPGNAFPASRLLHYVATGAGPWSGTGTSPWSLAAGGATGEDPPRPQDDVQFDDGSITTEGQQITIDQFRMGHHVDFSRVVTHGFTLLVGSPERTMYGDLSLSPKTSFSGSATVWSLRGRQLIRKITANGCPFVDVPVHVRGPGGTYALQDAFSGRQLATDAGGLNLNGQPVSVDSIDLSGAQSSGTYARALVMGASVATLLGPSGVVWDASVTNGLAFDAGTSRIVIADGGDLDKTATWGGLAYFDVEVLAAGLGKVNMLGSPSFHSILAHAAKSLVWQAGQTFTVATLQAAGGGPSAGHVWRSSAPGTVWNLVITAAANVAYVDVQDCVASGAGAPVLDVEGGVNSGRNVGWTFTQGSPEVGGLAVVTPEVASASTTPEIAGSARGPDS